MDCGAKFSLILGENGSGKTNLLEAISMLNAGKGLRNAVNADIIRDFDKGLAEWAVNIEYSNSESNFEILLGCKFKYISSNGQKIIKINNEELKKKTDILNFIRIIWLTPQMENLFLESPSVRRKFLDRMTFNFFPEHAVQILEYEYFLQSRNKILGDIDWDFNWLNHIEEKIAELSVVIIHNRLKCIKIINSFLDTLNIHYLKPIFDINGEIEMQLKLDDGARINEFIESKLKQCRAHDARSQRCSIGAHKSEIVVVDREKNRHASLCSTGEQKSMIIALLLGQSYAIYSHSKIAPILLLDEIFAHLDDKRRGDLVLELEKTPSQIWISSTDLNLDKLIVNSKKFVCSV
jgi:DNA replication and repair protein RecF